MYGEGNQIWTSSRISSLTNSASLQAHLRPVPVERDHRRLQKPDPVSVAQLRERLHEIRPAKKVGVGLSAVIGM